jgi:hypothetical protein
MMRGLLTIVAANDGSFDTPGVALLVAGWANTARPTQHHGRRFPERLKESAISAISECQLCQEAGQNRLQEGVCAGAALCTTARRFGVGDSGSPVFGAASGSFRSVLSATASWEPRRRSRILGHSSVSLPSPASSPRR